MPRYPTVDAALEALQDPELFARVAGVLLTDQYPDLVPTGRSGDLGRDAYVREGVLGAERLVIQYSLERDWPGKLRRELARYETDTTLPPRLLFVTNRSPQEDAVRRLRDEARRRHGVELTVYGREWLALRLDSWRHRETAERLLDVERSRRAGSSPRAATRSSSARSSRGSTRRSSSAPRARSRRRSVARGPYC